MTETVAGAGALQFVGARPDEQPIQLVMGLDFGTAYSKVVIGESRRAWAVPNPRGRRASPHLFPCALNILAGGRTRPGTSRYGKTVRDLKMRILLGQEDDALIGETVAYLAHLMRDARGWLLREHEDIYRGHYLDWNLNVGLPTEQFHNRNLQTFYRQIIHGAWAASAHDGEITLDLAMDCYADDGNSIHPDDVGVFPEFAAQINGYARSPRRNSGPHLLMDVGAGTVDVAFFNVHEQDDEDLFPVLSGIVEEQGVHVRHAHRLDALGKANGDPLAHFCEVASYAEEARALGTTVEQLREIDRPLKAKIHSQIRAAFAQAKIKYPNIGNHNNPVRVFLCGGGANVEMYRSLLQRLLDAGHPCNLELLYLPRPDRLAAGAEEDKHYDRLSVAYGLSFDQFSIGEIRPSDELDDLMSPSDPGRVMTRTCPVCAGTGGHRGNNECIRCDGRGYLV